MHKYVEVCECKKGKTEEKTEPHEFKNGKCDCGKNEVSEYENVLVMEYTYKNNKNYELASAFVEILIGSEDFVQYQEDDIIISPKPDEIRSDKFGNKYAYYDLSGIKPSEEFKVIIERGVKTSNYEKVIPANTNTEILEGFEIYLEPQERVDSNYEKIVSKAKELTKGCISDYKKAEAIFKFINTNMNASSSSEYANKGSISAIENMRGTSEEFSTLFVAMCRAVNIPSRVIEGYRIDGEDLAFVARAEIYLKNYGWLPVNPSTIYTVDKERKPYLDGFCKIKDNDFIATSIYYYEKGARTVKGVEEISNLEKLL